VLGLALAPAFRGQPFSITLVVVDQDRGELSRILQEEVFQGEALKDSFRLQGAPSPEEARQRVLRGQVTAALIIPEGFTALVYEGRSTSLEVISSTDAPLRGQIVKSIAEGFVTEILTRGAMAEVAAAELLSRGLITPEEISPLVQSWLPQLEQTRSLVTLGQQTEQSTQSSLPGAMGYYAISMSVMYVLFSANEGGRSLLQERRTGTINRLLSAPLSRSTILSGKILGVCFLALAQFLLVILVATLAYGVRWTDSPLGFVLMIACTVGCMSGLGVLLCSVFKTEAQAGAIGPAVAMILTFLAGGMFVFGQVPPWMNAVMHISPVRWAMDGFLELMNGRGVTAVLLPAGVLVAMGVAFLLVGVLRLWRWQDVA
jgi:ABC-2 type transport system permease protein